MSTDNIADVIEELKRGEERRGRREEGRERGGER